jgi:hypothetical protein
MLAGFRLEGPDPGLAAGILLHMPGLDDAPGRKGGAAHHAWRVLGNDFLVADAVLHRADRPIAENRRGGCHCRTGMQRLGGHDAELTGRNGRWIAARLWPRVERALAGQAQATPVDRIDMCLVQVIGPHLDIGQCGQMRCEQAADGAAADDTDFHAGLPCAI